jgi:hypothetical protein
MSVIQTRLVLITLIALSMAIPTSLAFSVSGSILKTDIDPGQAIVHTIVVKNNEDAPTLNMTAEVFGFGNSQTGQNIKYGPEDDNSPYSARSFLNVTPRSFTIGPGESQEVVLEGKIPDNVGAGGRYAVVGIKTEPMGEGDIGIITAVDVPIMLTIRGSEIIDAGEITDLDLLKGDNGLNANFLFKNTGNHHYKASSEMVIKNERKEVVADVTNPLDQTSILPGNTRQFNIQFDSDTELAPGTYTVEVSVTQENGTVLDSKNKTTEV